MGRNNMATKDKASAIKTNTPYDDVFRTLLNDCSTLILPMLNEVFGEHFTGAETIVHSKNEHYLNQQDGTEKERITDSSFTVIGQETKKYLFECQSTPDSSMLVRIFEYATQIALDEGIIIDNTLRSSFRTPQCSTYAANALPLTNCKLKSAHRVEMCHMMYL